MVKPLGTETAEMVAPLKNMKEEMEVLISVSAGKILSPFFVDISLGVFFGNFVGDFYECKRTFLLLRLLKVHPKAIGMFFFFIFVGF